MKKTFRKLAAAVLTGVLALSLAGCGGDSKEQKSAGKGEYANLKEVVLIGADTAGKGSAGQQFGELVSKKVDEITGGKLQIEYHPNGDLGGDEDLLRQLKSNDIQVFVSQPAPVVSFIPEMAVFDLPMAFAKYDGPTIDKVLNNPESKFYKQLAAAYDKAGFHYMGMLQNGTFRLATANTNLKDLDAYKGLKIRTMSNKNHMAFWTDIGAEPTPLAFSELYFALQSGTVNAEENAADTIVTMNFNEVQKFLAPTNHVLYTNQLAMNKKAYESLDPAYQKALNQAVSEALKELAPKLGEIDKQNKETLEKKGMTIIKYDKSFYDQVLALDSVKALYKDINSQINGIGDVLMQELDAAAKK